MTTRRDLLLTGAAGALVLAGCGDTSKLGGQTRKIARQSVGIDYASYYAPFEDVKRLALARGQAVGAQLTFSDDAAGSDAQVANLKGWTSAKSGFRAVVVAPFDATAVQPLVAPAVERGVAVVTYATPLEGASAAITVPNGRAGTLLAQDAARRGPGGKALLVGPPAGAMFGAGFAAVAAAIGKVVPVAATVQALGTADAEQVVRRALRGTAVRTVLTWNDTTALGAASAVGRDGYVGGLGAPSLTSRASLGALAGDGPLRCLVAARLADLAAALVDVPFAFARSGKGADREVPVTVLRRGIPAVRAWRADFTA